MNKNNILKYVAIVAPIVVVAGLGSLFVNLGLEWFDGLTKPSQWIPNIVIPIVWTFIYLDFAIVLSLWAKNEKLPKSTIVFLIINGVLNVLWCLVFFTLNLTFVGNIVILLNLIMAFVLIVDILLRKKWYALALAIYPTWITIATTLNLAMWILN